MVLKQLPIGSSLERYEKQSKELARAYRSGDLEAIQCIRQHHPRLAGRANTNDRDEVTDSNIRRAGVTLADAQSVVARWHGFESWSKLAKHIEALTRKNSRVLQFESAVEAIIIERVRPQPRCGWGSGCHLPRVAASRQPWALSRNPVGIHGSGEAARV